MDCVCQHIWIGDWLEIIAYGSFSKGCVISTPQPSTVTEYFNDGSLSLPLFPRTLKHSDIHQFNKPDNEQTGREREREMFYLTTHSTHFIYSYMASDIWLRTILIVRKETRCRHIGYSYQLAARVLLYAPSHRQDNTAFVTPVVEHWLEREIEQTGMKIKVLHDFKIR